MAHLICNHLRRLWVLRTSRRIAAIGIAVAVGLSSSPSLADKDPAAVIYQENLSFVSAYGEGMAAVLRRHGELNLTAKEPNRFYPEKHNEIYTLRLPGVEVTWLRPSPFPDVYIRRSMSISGTQYELPFARMGESTKQNIISAFGHDAQGTENTLVFWAPTHHGSNKITFVLREGKLERMEWRWAID
jgi:hypothetical protein